MLNRLGANAVPRLGQSMSTTCPRLESHIDEVAKYETEAGSLFTLYKVNWTNSENELRSLDMCHFRNLCVDNRRLKDMPNRYWLLADVDELEIRNHEVKEAFSACMRREGLGVQRTLGLKYLEQQEIEMDWVRGTTFGFQKDEGGNHPASWSRVSTWQNEPVLDRCSPDTHKRPAGVGWFRFGGNPWMANIAQSGGQFIVILRPFPGVLTY